MKGSEIASSSLSHSLSSFRRNHKSKWRHLSDVVKVTQTWWMTRMKHFMRRQSTTEKGMSEVSMTRMDLQRVTRVMRVTIKMMERSPSTHCLILLSLHPLESERVAQLQIWRVTPPYHSITPQWRVVCSLGSPQIVTLFLQSVTAIHKHIVYSVCK